jgi:hypothetical protein
LSLSSAVLSRVPTCYSCASSVTILGSQQLFRPLDSTPHALHLNQTARPSHCTSIKQLVPRIAPQSNSSSLALYLNQTARPSHCTSIKQLVPRIVPQSNSSSLTLYLNQTARPSHCTSIKQLVPRIVPQSNSSSLALYLNQTARPSHCTSIKHLVPDVVLESKPLVPRTPLVTPFRFTEEHPQNSPKRHKLTHKRSPLLSTLTWTTDQNPKRVPF